jgi:hypothetical protein
MSKLLLLLRLFLSSRKVNAPGVRARAARIDPLCLWVDGLAIRSNDADADVVMSTSHEPSRLALGEFEVEVQEKSSSIRTERAACESTERATFDAEVALSILLWFRNNFILPTIVGILANYIFAKYHNTAPSSKRVRVTLVFDINGETRRVEFAGPYELVAKQLQQFNPSKIIEPPM